MKHLSLVVNIVLFVAVGILYYLHFSSVKPNEKKKKNQITQLAKANGNSPLIGYVDLDSLNEHISFIKNNRKLLESEQMAIEKEWENAYRNLQAQKDNFLKRGNSITQAEAEEFQGKLIQQQQIVDEKKQNSTQALNDKSYKFLDDVQKKLKAFLVDYNQDNKFNYIFTTGNGLEYMVYKDSALNITNDVVEGMNEILNNEKK
jgi:outer membrane protein